MGGEREREREKEKEKSEFSPCLRRVLSRPERKNSKTRKILSLSLSLSNSPIAACPAPEAAWYVETTILLTVAALCSGVTATRAMIVEQFGLATMPPFPAFMPFIASGLISGMTRGTPSVMRKAEELSTTVAPAAEASGANFLEIEPPAENSAMSTSPKEFSVSSSTVIVAPSQS